MYQELKIGWSKFSLHRNENNYLLLLKGFVAKVLKYKALNIKLCMHPLVMSPYLHEIIDK